MVGLGRMGKHMALLLQERGHNVLCWNRSPEPREEVAAKGCRTVDDYKKIASLMAPPRVVWLMLPTGDVTDQILFEILDTLSPGDIIVNGANAHYKDTLYHAARIGARGVRFLDIGVSGGTLAVELGGYCCMAGGDESAFSHITPLLASLCLKDAYGYFGPAGCGHYIKMIHNGIEYAHMQAIAEGFELIKRGFYPGVDLHKVAVVWNHGSIVAGTLMTATERALRVDQTLKDIAPYVADTGEGRWTVIEAIERGVPFIAGANALFSRFQTRESDCYAYKLMAAQRNAFGGHAVKKE